MRINRKTKPGIFYIILSFLLMVPAVLFIVNCSSGGTNAKKLPLEKLPNIIVIVMDTVRYDHLSCHGYERETTPNLTKLAKDSRMYMNAYSTSGWTPPSHASLFTGLYPAAHGTTQENNILPLGVNTMAEMLLTKGYDTYAISENPLISMDNQFDQGFLHFFEAWLQPNYHYSNGAYNVFELFLEQRNKEKPFFLFINLIEPHSPYDSARFFVHRFIRNIEINCIGNRYMDVVLGKKKLTAQEIEHLIDRYDGEILYTDYLLGKIIGQLKENKIWGDTLFIVTSDHGENFMEHGLTDHVFSLNQELIHVPLIIKYPGLFPPNTKESAPVQLTDIFHTVLDIVGLDKNKFNSQGCSLLNKKELVKRTVFAEYYAPKQVFTAIRNREMPLTEEEKKKLKQNKKERQERRKFIDLKEKFPFLEKYHRRIKTVIKDNFKLIWGSDGMHELYNLETDRNEQENLINEKKYVKVKLRLLNELKKLVKKYQQESPIRRGKKTRKSNKKDKQTEKALKTLGYL
jgi:arylsulfatase A-like enzyme